MSQVGWARASCGDDVVQFVPGLAAERAAGGRQDQPVHLGGGAGAQALGNRRVLGVHGTIWPSRAAALTSAPPTISDSLLARASVAPVSSAASVGASPMEPVMPLRTTSALDFRDPGGGVRAGDDLGPVAGDAGRAGGVVDHVPAGRRRPRRRHRRPGRRVWTACRARSSRLPPPALSATTSKRCGAPSTTSIACVPMEPVDPRRTILRGCMLKYPAPRAGPVPARVGRSRQCRRETLPDVPSRAAGGAHVDAAAREA